MKASWPAIILSAVLIATATATAQTLTFTENPDALLLVSPHGALPVLSDSHDPPAVHLAIQSFVYDVERVTGRRLEVYNDTLPPDNTRAIIVGTVQSRLVGSLQPDTERQVFFVSSTEGQREAYDIRTLYRPLSGLAEALVIRGSDKVSLARYLP